MESSLLLTQSALLILLLVASLAAIAFKRIHFPYTVGLVIIGLGLGFLAQQVETLSPLSQLTLSHDLILFIFLPPLVFESALNLDARLLLRNLIPVMILAVPGLLISTAIVGVLLAQLTPLSLPEALIFGALITATDPVAVIALFKELGAPKRLMVLVEGESLFNDATAIVTFNIILAAIALGSFSATTLSQGGGLFLSSFFGGIVVGLFVGSLMGYFIALAKKNALILGAISTVVAYGAFIIAEHVFHVSGVIAVVSAGMVVGWLVSIGLQPQVRQFLHEFWEYLAFLANSLIFLLVGLTTAGFIVQLGAAEPVAMALIWAIAAILIARGAVVFGLMPLANRWQPSDPVPFSYQVTATPLEIRIERRFIRLLGKLAPHDSWVKQRRLITLKNRYEYNTAVAEVGKQVLTRIRQMNNVKDMDAEMVEEFTQCYENMAETAMQKLAASAEKHPQQAIAFERQMAHRMAALSQQSAIAQLVAEGAITETVAASAYQMIEKQYA